MVNNSAESFAALVSEPCELCLTCEDDYEWESDFIISPFKTQHTPLFNLTLKMKDEGAYFSQDPYIFGVSIINFLVLLDLVFLYFKAQVKIVLLLFLSKLPNGFDLDFLSEVETLLYFGLQKSMINLFDSTIRASHSIKQVHPMYLPNLKFPEDLCLSSLGLLSDHICELRERIRVGFEKAVIPLLAYAKAYDCYLPFFTLDVPEFIE